ncbi:hypothetical protein B0X71_08005 [Planococcus lenghuensis]|uniref:Methylmalonyl-CoA mutase alpha/beta chain catalytic domain-containing protein n=2 Tax=Planococcus lenghuensis TaxID=2213202 RepID=A0A1Q2L3P8_9BACL|nr:hypothetical protein B0X71_08005 [Planococcus lenghuensis]
MKQQQFTDVTYGEWKQHAEAVLKGKPFDSLQTRTAEDVELQPLYTKETAEALGDALERQVRAMRLSKTARDFLIAQEANGQPAVNAEKLLKKIRDSLDRGNEMIVYTHAEGLDWTADNLDEFRELLARYPFYLKTRGDGKFVRQLLDEMTTEQAENVSGVILSDKPIEAPRGVRNKCADTVPVHLAGGSAVQEIAVALSLLAEKADADNFEESAASLWVRFAVNTDFFSEIAKLRAFRTVWAAFCSAYGSAVPSIPVFTETSLRSYSKADPYVNLLRAGNSAFSAVLGGSDAHTVLPHDILTGSTPASLRVARNVQLIIREETHTRHVQDAAAGSFFIEQLTHDYAEAAWAHFLKIEEAGGYSEVIRSGWLADELQAKWQEREHRAAIRKEVLVGTNKYADPEERMQEVDLESKAEIMTAKRLAQPFEQVRERLSRTSLKTAILHLGPLKEVKVKSDFVKGVLAVGGLIPEDSPENTDGPAASAFIRKHGIQYAVLVGSEEEIERAVLHLASAGAVLDVAGRYGAGQLAQWRGQGISGSVFTGQNILEKLEQLAAIGQGGEQNDET